MDSLNGESTGKKYPYYISVKGSRILTLGGVGNVWNDRQTGEVVESFSIITVPANPLMKQIHNTRKRMPLIISEKDSWLDLSATREDLKKMMLPFPEKQMNAYPICNRLNHFQRENTNTEDITDKVDYPELPAIE